MKHELQRLVGLVAIAFALGACGGGAASMGETSTFATGGTVCVNGPDGLPLVENTERLTRVRSEGDFSALVAEAESHWSMRHERTHAEAAIDAWERAVLAPTPAGVNRQQALAEVFVELSKAYYWLAHGHVRYDADNEATMMRLYETGMACGGNALALGNPEWNRAMLYETPIADAVGVLSPSDTGAIYWYATNLGRWGLIRGIATMLSRIPDIFAMMSTVEAQSPDYFYGATNRYFGVYYTKLPFGNPDVDQAEQRLVACINAYPEYLETRVLYAHDWAIVTQNRAVAEAQLNAVLEAELDPESPVYAENVNAQRRAAEILEELDELFR